MFDIFITNPRCYRVMQQRPTDITDWTKYKTVNKELTSQQLTAHLQGEKTLSASLVWNEQAQAMGLDIDAGGLDAGLRALREAHAMGIHALFIYEPGNVGGHDGGMLWAKLDAPVYWKRAWTLMDDLRDRADLTNAEAFPNPLPFRLPFGVNLGCDPPTRGILYTQDGQVIDLDSDDWHHHAAPIWNSLTPYPTAALPEAPEPVTPQIAVRRGDIEPLDEKDIIGLYNVHLEIDDLVELLERNSDYQRARWNYRTGGAIMHCGCGNHQHNDRTPSLELRPATTDIRRGWNLIGHSPHCQHHPRIGQVDDPFNILLDQHGGNHRTAMREARQFVNAKRRDDTRRRDTTNTPEPHSGSGSNRETGDRVCYNEKGGTKNYPQRTSHTLPPPYQPPITTPLATLVKTDDAPPDPGPTHTSHPLETYLQAHGTASDYYLYRAYCDLGRDATNTQLNAHIAQHRLRPYSTGHLRRSKMKFWQLIREWNENRTRDQNDHPDVYIYHDHETHESWTCDKQDSFTATTEGRVSGGATRSSTENHPPDDVCLTTSLPDAGAASHTGTLQLGNEVVIDTGERDAERCPLSNTVPLTDAAASLPHVSNPTAEIRSHVTEASMVREGTVAMSNRTGDDNIACGHRRVRSPHKARDLSVVTSTGYDTPESLRVPNADTSSGRIDAPTAEYSATHSFDPSNGSPPGASYREPKRRPLPKDPRLRAMEQQRRRCERYAAMSLDDLQVTWAKLKGAARKARGRRQKALEHQVKSVEQIIARKRGQGMQTMLLVNPDAVRGETPVQLHTPPVEGLHAPITPPAPVQTPAKDPAPQTPPQTCVSQVQSEVVAAEDDGGVIRPVCRGLKRATPSIAYSKGVYGTPVSHRPVSQRRAQTNPNDPWVQLQRSSLAKAEREGNTERAAWYRQVLANVGIDVPMSEPTSEPVRPAASGELRGVLVGHVNSVVTENVGEVVPRLSLGVSGTGPVVDTPVHLAPQKPLGKIPPEPVQSLGRNPQPLTRLADRVLEPSGTRTPITPQVVVPPVGQCLNRVPQLLPTRAVQIVPDRAFTPPFGRRLPHPNAPVLPVYVIGLESGGLVVSKPTRGDGIKHLQLLITTLGVIGHRLSDFLDGRVVIAPAYPPWFLAPHIGRHERAFITGPAACTPERVKLAERGQQLINCGPTEVFAPLLLTALPERVEALSNGILVDVLDILRSVFAGQRSEQTIDSPAIAAGRFVTVDVPVVGSIRFVVMPTATWLEIEHAANLMTHTRTFRHDALPPLCVRGPPRADAGWVGEKPPAAVSPPAAHLCRPDHGILHTSGGKARGERCR